MRVLKFGGSSVGTPQMIGRVISICTDPSSTLKPDVVVVSAFQGVTNTLLELANHAALHTPEAREHVATTLEQLKTRHREAFNTLTSNTEGRQELYSEVLAAREQMERWFQSLTGLLDGVYLLRECSPRTIDHIASFGECLSALTVATALRCTGVNARFAHAGDFVLVEGQHGRARVDFNRTYPLIRQSLSDTSVLYVVTGFIGADSEGIIHTLGRGGSDYTASIVAAALKASVLEIWTDVDGVMTCDPRKVLSAFSLEELSYQEALELCHFGAKVIYPPTLQPAMALKIPIRILNTFAPDRHGSLICDSPTPTTRPITGISSIGSISLIQVQGSGMVGVAGTAMRLFRTLATLQVNVILITQASSEHSICVAIKHAEAPEALKALNHEFTSEISAGEIDPITVEAGLAIVTVVGEQLRHRVGISGKVFGSLGRNGINIRAIAQGASERSISVVVDEIDENKSLNALHDEFFANVKKRAHLVVIGTGLIGSTFLRQVVEHREMIRDQHDIDLIVIGLARSKARAFNMKGFSSQELLHPAATLSQNTFENFELSLADEVRNLRLPHTIVIDCTASEKVSHGYTDFLKAHLPIVTPNKKFQSGPYSRYAELKELSRFSGVDFLYETSVGAGLPIIGTLNDLLRSGDKVIRIEAVLSGTLSFIFNTWDGSESFSAMVRKAKESGYTEPDPREDLSGTDVGRKILILARECGAHLEFADVEIANLCPATCRDASSIEEFFSRLASFDEEFEDQRRQAELNGERLRYVATYVRDAAETTTSAGESDFPQMGGAKTGLLSVGQNHPFYNLSGGDNIVSFTTERYCERPLVVKGPGAGAEVTAAGVLADVIRLLKV
jgi:aspartokinase/homoserine dehydrogenase 1